MQASITLLAALLTLAGCRIAPREPLGRAAARGDVGEIARLMQRGATPAERRDALVWAARYGQPESISALVGRGAHPDATRDDWTPMLHAVHKNRTESVVALIESGADINAPGGNGETPLMMAAGYGYAHLVRVLLEHGADARRTLASGATALDFAVTGVFDVERFTWGRCQVESVRVLVRSAPGLSSLNDWRTRCGLRSAP